MKIAKYVPSTIDIMDVLNPNYFGYRSKFFPGYNLPINCRKDFPKFCTEMAEFTGGNDADLQSLLKDPYVIDKNYRIYDDAVKLEKIENVYCGDPDMFTFAVLVTLINVAPGGNCVLALDLKSNVLDNIYILANAFGKCSISGNFIILNKLNRSKKYIQTLINYYRYYLDCPIKIRPIIKNKDDLVIKKILNRFDIF